MKARYINTLVLILAGCVTSAGAMEPSAVLQQPQGRVFVGQTTAMGPARDGMPLYAGNRVVAVAGGRAQVVYPNGCAVAVPENSILAITGPNQCRTGQALVRATGGFQKKTIGQGPDADVVQLVGQFDSLSPQNLVNAYNGLSVAQQTQLVGMLNTDQLVKLYVAIGNVTSPAAAEAFLAQISAVNTQFAATMAAGATTAVTTGAGLVIGGVTLTAAQVAAAVGLITVVSAGVIESNQQEEPPASQ